MPKPMAPLRRGRIIWAKVRDRNGFAKVRPSIIITATDQIAEQAPRLEVMAITTSYAAPLPGDHVELPWHPRGHPRTRLNKRAAAVVTWLDEINSDHIEGFAGDVPTKLMIEILSRLSDEEA